MATSVDYIEFVCEQLHSYSPIRYRKMFGEYMVYYNDKPILLVCDNTVYIKEFTELSAFMADAERDFPYNGAKEHYILDIENEEVIEKVIPILETLTPIPKKKIRSK